MTLLILFCYCDSRQLLQLGRFTVPGEYLMCDIDNNIVSLADLWELNCHWDAQKPPMYCALLEFILLMHLFLGQMGENLSS